MWKRWLLAASTALILILTLSPQQAGVDTGQAALGPFGERGLADSIANLLLFLPLGVAAGLNFRRRRTAVLAGALLSAAVELAQLWIPGRFPSLWDLGFNTGGTAIGMALAGQARALLAPPPRLRRRLFGFSLAAALAVLVGGATLFAPARARGPLRVEWTPPTESGDRYSGQVLEARLGEHRLGQGEIVDGRAPMARLNGGERLSLLLSAGAPPAVWVPLVRVVDRHEHALLAVAARGADISFSYRARASALHLDQPRIRLRGAVSRVSPGGTVTISAWAEDGTSCVSADTLVGCAGPSFAETWGLLLYPAPLSAGVVSCAWLALLLLPAGFWAPGMRSAALALVGLVIVLEVSAPFLAVTPVGIGSLACAAAGLGCGLLLGRGSRRA